VLRRVSGCEATSSQTCKMSATGTPCERLRTEDRLPESRHADIDVGPEFGAFRRQPHAFENVAVEAFEIEYGGTPCTNPNPRDSAAAKSRDMPGSVVVLTLGWTP